MTPTSTTAVMFENVSRHFGAVRAVDGVDLKIGQGEFFAMLGPSGSGKTTCLRLIAGFEQPTAGHIEIFGETAEGLAPNRRDVNTVFQDYALFPHMTVLQNVAYGLMVRGVPRLEREKCAREALSLVRLEGMDLRRPAQLSGGQRQRVALARALVNRPKVLLLDEPLGALDLKLREEMQDELRRLHKQLGLTFVFVTHDQGEALSMADRVAVFNKGRIVQIGTPEDIYQRPTTRFVADFVGSSNVLTPDEAPRFGGVSRWTSLRPESILIGAVADAMDVRHTAEVIDQQFQGAMRKTRLKINGLEIYAMAPSSQAFDVGQAVTVGWARSALHAMDGEGNDV
ncbi:polyamine ABC transporter ATP-binding protein [Pleomorphomonas diazotrophica]|uniref:Polyamine ABC transporter ATP-binding protein n=1 Tax=Pleomorphomonas diazotrophica TaxID=1166257 RepID=A0A1I4SEG7_9HYPH|nr:ABC transporter ATP-binding protein [Pleomorphomonas diazotrophica]PKR88902.1 polyamine ABC transporter ATP-binding protein [Pleomorphomonas diazotrophica]SFM62888.1 putative spermidine/putrescine transport system ATP-binding protein [Pleomorphomonas diazotrophica]